MIIYIDENMSPFLAKGFQVLQAPENIKLKQSINVESIKEKFGRGVKDEDWIPLAGQTAACIITQELLRIIIFIGLKASMIYAYNIN